MPDEEAQHLTRVLRLRAGAPIRVFDGRGREFDAVVRHATKGTVTVALGSKRDAAAAEIRVAVTLAAAVLKGDKMDAVIRDAVMMGVAAIQPTVTARSEVSLASLARGHRRERWERIALSSAKQCGRAVVPLVHDPCDFDSLVAAMPLRDAGETSGAGGTWKAREGLMLVEPSATCDAAAVGDLDRRAPRDTTLVVGPEGGWAAEELARAAGTCRFVRLGSRTLRADAASLVALAALLTVWGEL